MTELGPILAILMAVGGFAAVVVRFVLRKPPERSLPAQARETDKTEAVERREIEERAEAKAAEVEDIDAAPDRERTRRAGDRLR